MTGEQGLGFITHGRAGPERVGTFIDIYKEALKDANPVGKFINDRLVVDTFCYCDEDGEQARQRGTQAAAEQLKENSTSFSRFWAGISEDRLRHSSAGDEFPSPLWEVRDPPLPRKRKESSGFGPASQRR